MQRGHWVFLTIFSLVVVVLGLMMFQLREGVGRARADASVQEVRIYAVPPERAESIRDSLRTVLLANREGAQPLGHASLPMPDRLVVAAPASMQDSIQIAIKQLSEGAETVAEAASMRNSAFDIWVLEAAPEAQADDAALAGLRPVLDQARGIFGLGAFRLADRITLVAGADDRNSTGGGVMEGDTNDMSVRIAIKSITAEGADLELSLGWQPAGRSLFSRLNVRNDQWQVVGLLGGDTSDRPERLLLMRQRLLEAKP